MSEHPSASAGPLSLDVSIRGRHLVVTIANASTREQRLWEFDNSWGWRSLAIDVRGPADEQVEIVRSPREWSKNGPVAFELAPQQRRDVTLDLHDGYWEPANGDAGRSVLARARSAPLRLRARLHIEPTPEAERQHVFIGAASSEWVDARPPHDWLPDPA